MTTPNAWELFTPKLLTVLREGYSARALRADLLAGLTVAIVALPLSMAIAIASGVGPERGLFTAVVGGFLISALGGSRFQIGGPAAAFTVLVAATVARHGVDGMLLATMLAGLMLMVLGALRLGSYIKFVPHPVTVGFISGIAVILLVGQIADLLGLRIETSPPEVLGKLTAIAAALPSTNAAAVAVSAATIALILAARKYTPRLPGILLAVIAAAALAALFKLPLETIGTRFGGIASAPPAPMVPPVSLDKIAAVLPDALAFALLGAVESLLSAMVADGMTGRRHRSNVELVAQGIANIGAALFGGICATGTVARTATNVRAGAHGPVSGMSHAVFILVFMLVAAPLAAYIPLAALAAVLVVVAWGMAERHAFLTLMRAAPGDKIVLLVTFALTIFVGLSEAIVVGFALGALVFIHRLAQTAGVESLVPQAGEDLADDPARAPYDPSADGADPDIAVYRLRGAFFFGAAATVATVLDRIADRHRAFIIDFSAIPAIDSTAANVIAGIVGKAEHNGTRVLIAGADQIVKKALVAQGVKPPRVTFHSDLANAGAAARLALSAPPPP